MIVPLLALVLTLGAMSACSSWNRRRKLLARLRANWGKARGDPADMESVADFFRSHDAGPSLDDRTWSDLLLDDVFAVLDRTESSVGQQVLYHRIRLAPAARTLDALEALVARVSSDARLRERAQVALASLRHSSGYYLHRLARPDALIRKPWHVVFPIWAAIIAATLALGVVWHVLLFVAIAGAVINSGVRIATGRRVGGEIVWFRQVGPLLASARALTIFDVEATAAITGSMKPDLVALRPLEAIARWVSRDPLTTDPILAALLEYLNLLFLMDVNALYFASRELRTRSPELLRVIEVVGEIDAAIAVASFRGSARGWVRPKFAASNASAVLSDLRHPLVDDAVPNSIALAPPHGVLVTGSNMSGKSTLLRTVGVNAVLAQSLNTCLAGAYDAPVYQIRSCIGRTDDLLAGKSYYLVEVESVLALVAASERREPHLFIFDELFRGTNAVERIAAGEAVLRALIEKGKPHVVLAATHDGELVDLLADTYTVCHLGDAIGPEGLTFDYHLKSGPATSRNAIALLKLNGAPEPLVTRALDRAAALDRQRRAPEHAQRSS